METAKLEFALMPSPSDSGNVGKFPGRHILEALSGPSPHLEQHSFALSRNVGSLPLVHQQEDSRYAYSRRVDNPLSSNHNEGSFQSPQEPVVHRVDPYLYCSDSSQYFHQSQSHYHSSPDAEAFPPDIQAQAHFDTQFSPMEVGSSSLSLAVTFQTHGTTSSSISPDLNALRRYHEAQSQQHAQVLQQLTRAKDGRRSSSLDIARNTAFLEEMVPVSDVGLYHTPSSIPMSNDQQRSQQSPEITPRQLHHSLPSNHYRYPYPNDENFGYHQKDSADNFNISNTHIPMVQTVRVYQETPHEPTTAFHTPTAAVLGPTIMSPSASTPLHSTLDILRSGVRSNTGQPPPIQRSPSSQSLARTSLARCSSDGQPSHAAAISVSSFSGMKNGSDHDEVVGNRDLIGMARGDLMLDEKKLSVVKDEGKNGSTRAIVVEEVVENHHRINGGKRQGKRKNGDVHRPLGDSTGTGHPTDGDSKDPSEEILPPAKKRKKSKMHECEVCHKKFPRPSGLKTHMNTHNNERPFPCHYPGCNRSFGVRSNAKRHLRTHGVIPPQNTGTQPYVVDFSTPMVLEHGGMGTLNGSRVEGVGESSGQGTDQGRSTAVAGASQPVRSGRGRGRQFKLRWMPPSSTTRATAKGKGKKQAGSSSSKSEIPNGRSSRSSSQGMLEEDADGQTCDDDEMVDHEEEPDRDTEGESDQSGEEDYELTTPMKPDHPLFLSSSDQSSQASSSRVSLSTVSSGSGGGSTSTLSSSIHHQPSGSTYTGSSPRLSAYSATTTHNSSLLSPPEGHRRNLAPHQLYHTPQQVEQMSLSVFVSSLR